MDINELRQLLQDKSARIQAQADQILPLEKDKADAELSLLANATSSFSPIPATNLSGSLNTVASMDNRRVSDICNDICKSLLSQIERRLVAFFSNLPQQRYSGPSVASTAASTSPQIPTGLPGVFSPPSLQSSRGLSASAPTFAVSNTNAMTTSQNEYDKAVEVDQRKLQDPDLTPVAIRKWRTTYDLYANDPARRMTMAQAFGDVSL